jgi:hypothetical protein
MLGFADHDWGGEKYVHHALPFFWCIGLVANVCNKYDRALQFLIWSGKTLVFGWVIVTSSQKHSFGFLLCVCVCVCFGGLVLLSGNKLPETHSFGFVCVRFETSFVWWWALFCVCVFLEEFCFVESWWAHRKKEMPSLAFLCVWKTWFVCVCVFDEPALRRKKALVGSLRRSSRRRTCALCFWFCLVILSGDPERGLHKPNSQKLLSVWQRIGFQIFKGTTPLCKQTNKRLSPPSPSLHYIVVVLLFVSCIDDDKKTTIRHNPISNFDHKLLLSNSIAAAAAAQRSRRRRRRSKRERRVLVQWRSLFRNWKQPPPLLQCCSFKTLLLLTKHSAEFRTQWRSPILLCTAAPPCLSPDPRASRFPWNMAPPQ